MVAGFDSIGYGTVGDLQALVDNGKRLAQLLLVDAERGVRVEGVPPDQCIKPVFAEEFSEGSHFFGGSVERRHRLLCFPIANEFYDPEETDRPHRANRRVLGLQFRAELLYGSAPFA